MTTALRIIAEDAEHVVAAGDELVLGREPEPGLALAGEGVSRRHARVYAVGGAWVIEDLGSTNGTWIGGRRVASVAVRGPVSVQLGPPATGARVWLEPLADDRPGPAPAPAVVAPPPAGVLALLVGGVLLCATGILVLDWYDVGLSSDVLDVRAGTGLELDGEGLGVAGGALGGFLALLGLSAKAPPRSVGLLIALCAALTGLTAGYLMVEPQVEDQVASLPGIEVLIDVRLDIGGFVTVAGAVMMLVGAAFLTLEPARTEGPPGPLP